MKQQLTSLIILLIFSALSTPVTSQRLEIPKNNPDNSLDLKVVANTYTVTESSRTHYSQYEADFLLLKINNAYLPKNKTGIDKKTFNTYLGNCPKALDLGLQGLKGKKQAKNLTRLGWASGIGFLLGAGKVASSAFEDESSSKGILAGVLAGAGFASYISFNILAGKKETKARKHIIESFDKYNSQCYDSSLNNIPIAENAIDNGASNRDEKIGVDVLANAPGSAHISVGPLVATGSLDDNYFSYGGSFLYLSDDLSPQYLLSVGGGFPFFTKETEGQTLNKEKAYNLDTYIYMDNTISLKSLKVEGAFNHYQMYNLSNSSVGDYHVRGSLIRAGLSWNRMMDVIYNIDDNRFTEKKRVQMKNRSFYAHAVYNLSSEYEFLSSNTEEPDRSDLGIALGVRGRKSIFNTKSLALNYGFEIGSLPVHNSRDGLAMRITLGLDWYQIAGRN